ncbi:MAG: N-6 DNA methylase [Pseudomonas sp.]
MHRRYGSLTKNRTSFAWLQYAVSALKDEGWAAVVMPGGTLFRGGAEKEIRSRMIDDGVVQAIISLPSALFADCVTKWRTGHGYQNMPGFSASVAIDRLRAEDYVLIPARYVGRSGALDIPAKSVSELRHDLVALEWRAAAANEAAARHLDRIQTWIP